MLLLKWMNHKTRHILYTNNIFLKLLILFYFYIFQIAIFMYWAVCFLLSIFIISHQILLKSQATNSTRKHFHILATFVYIPGMIYDLPLLYLASGAMFVLLIALEVCSYAIIAVYVYLYIIIRFQWYNSYLIFVCLI